KALDEEPDSLFVYGDNMQRWGKGGQAVIRDCPNAIGIATKKAPKREEDAYFTDRDLDWFRKEITDKSSILRSHLAAGRDVYWPMDGIGTGLADLKSRSPLIWHELNKHTRDLFDEYCKENYHTVLICGGRDFTNRKFGFA